MMKKNSVYIALLFCFAVLFLSTIKAQNIRIPNASFESWTNSGHFIPVKTLDDWHGLNFKVGSMQYDLVKPMQTTDAQDSTYAVSLSTTQLNPTISSMLKRLVLAVDSTGYLDSIIDFTHPFDGVLSNSSIDIISVLTSFADFPFSWEDTTLLSNLDSLFSLMNLLSQMDIGKFLDGGLSVTSKVPHRLSGYYKYVKGMPKIDSAGAVDSVDNGLAVMIGIGWDSVSQHNVFTGGGISLLQPTSVYRKFSVDYLQFGQLFPDTVVFLFLSSISNGLPGSMLMVDNLRLNTYTIDTMKGLTLDSVSAHKAYLHWTRTPNAFAWQIACGNRNTLPDSMPHVLSMQSKYTCSSLLSNTDYAIYVRPMIAINLYGPWSEAILFHTIDDAGIDEVDVLSIDAKIYPNPANGYFVVEIPKDDQVRMLICNTLGQCVLQRELTESRTYCKVEVPGVYFVRLVSAKGSSTYRLLVQ